MVHRTQTGIRQSILVPTYPPSTSSSYLDKLDYLCCYNKMPPHLTPYDRFLYESNPVPPNRDTRSTDNHA
jgi:hypothetical protein